ncbi:MAG TPA: hypothetical protein VE326_11210 [Candidatus Binatia bacterium]|nr:hypothetical protein [Candidatus Binatia bacterium]
MSEHQICDICGHQTYPAVLCGRGSRCMFSASSTRPAAAGTHLHCLSDCWCTDGGCLTAPLREVADR